MAVVELVAFVRKVISMQCFNDLALCERDRDREWDEIHKISNQATDFRSARV